MFQWNIPSDLRWRMVHQRCLMGLTSAEVAKRLNVDPTTVTKTVQLFEETGTVCSIQGYHQNTRKILSTQDEFVRFEAVTSNPSIYLHEIQHTLLQATGKHLSISAICKLLHKNRFSRKILAYRALQRSQDRIRTTNTGICR